MLGASPGPRGPLLLGPFLGNSLGLLEFRVFCGGGSWDKSSGFGGINDREPRSAQLAAKLAVEVA